MGTGDWFKTIVSRKKAKKNSSKKVKGSPNQLNEVSSQLQNRLNFEEIAAIRIQSAFRRFRARKALRHLKGLKRLQILREGFSVKKQTSITLSHLHSWSKIQAEIRARRICMVTEGRIKQKRQENQVKLDAKLHEIETEWCGGSDTMDEILSRIHQREEAAVKRERAMAYAFSHQWRANSGQGQFSYEFGKGNWGWSWVERWIAARPWEARNSPHPASPPKVLTVKATFKADKKTNSTPGRVPPKPASSINGNGSEKKKTPSKPLTDEKTVAEEPSPKPAPASSQTKRKIMKQTQHDPPTQTNGIAV
ncbi:protein IQ-DOMAIN 1 isoform X1 [Iris pallida]|uniref:Protein IQ-DOMAIN 1 isoform X1 n=1 Tax=Iris pallida TaxID=29817 RepID=A0AAX6EW86_IRIPA|nr:protein IQ-DOMAIN 1 isoform X1 [Iris pallida]